MAKAIRQYNTNPFRLPSKLEQQLKKLALPPDVAQQFRELALSPDAVRQLKILLPIEWPPELMQAVEEAAVAAAAQPPTQASEEATVTAAPSAARGEAAEVPAQNVAPVIARIPTKAWYADWRNANPKPRGMTDTDYAKWLHGDMEKAPVTVFWTEATCRRRLYLDRVGGNLDIDSPGSDGRDPRPH